MIGLETAIKRAFLNEEVGPRLFNRTTTTLTTAGALTYTAAQILTGRINRDPNGAGRTDTFPTAALLVAALRAKASEYGVDLPRYFVLDLIIQNDADAAETITIAAGTGGTIVAGHTTTVAQNASRRYEITVDSLLGSEAYSVRNVGGFTT